MADRDQIPRNGGMNDGTYRIELTGDETWNGRALHYMRRDELSYMWGTMIQQALAGAYLVEEHRGRGPPYPQNYRP